MAVQTMDTKTVFDQDGVRIVLSTEHDPEPNPRTDGDWATDADVAAWRRDEWAYVILTATVHLDGVELASDSLGSVVSGTLPGDLGVTIECDPFEWALPRTVQEDGRTIHYAGSSAHGVVETAVGQAQDWLVRNTGRENAMDSARAFLGEES